MKSIEYESRMLERYISVNLIVLGVLLIISGLVWGIANYDCTEYERCDGVIIRECIEVDANQIIGFSISLFGIIIALNGWVLSRYAFGGLDE